VGFRLGKDRVDRRQARFRIGFETGAGFVQR
jgi:hypothetical protein